MRKTGHPRRAGHPGAPSRLPAIGAAGEKAPLRHRRPHRRGGGGNVGSEQSKDYSAVGDIVNLCKRLQELAGSDQILISRKVYNGIRDQVRVESLPPVQVKGRQTLEEVFRLSE
jgi:hypothetical protein